MGVRWTGSGGQADLVLAKSTFYLCVVVEVPEESPFDPTGVLGINPPEISS